ncbi:hypothetical protein ACQP3L_34415, partial [Escherichia coli]
TLNMLGNSSTPEPRHPAPVFSYKNAPPEPKLSVLRETMRFQFPSCYKLLEMSQKWDHAVTS